MKLTIVISLITLFFLISSGKETDDSYRLAQAIVSYLYDCGYVDDYRIENLFTEEEYIDALSYVDNFQQIANLFGYNVDKILERMHEKCYESVCIHTVEIIDSIKKRESKPALMSKFWIAIEDLKEIAFPDGKL